MVEEVEVAKAEDLIPPVIVPVTAPPTSASSPPSAVEESPKAQDAEIVEAVDAVKAEDATPPVLTTVIALPTTASITPPAVEALPKTSETENQKAEDLSAPVEASKPSALAKPSPSPLLGKEITSTSKNTKQEDEPQTASPESETAENGAVKEGNDDDMIHADVSTKRSGGNNNTSTETIPLEKLVAEMKKWYTLEVVPCTKSDFVGHASIGNQDRIFKAAYYALYRLQELNKVTMPGKIPISCTKADESDNFHTYSFSLALTLQGPDALESAINIMDYAVRQSKDTTGAAGSKSMELISANMRNEAARAPKSALPDVDMIKSSLRGGAVLPEEDPDSTGKI